MEHHQDIVLRYIISNTTQYQKISIISMAVLHAEIKKSANVYIILPLCKYFIFVVGADRSLLEHEPYVYN